MVNKLLTVISFHVVVLVLVTMPRNGPTNRCGFTYEDAAVLALDARLPKIPPASSYVINWI